jgi:hypothetical protein
MLARMAAAWARTSHDHGLLATAGAAGAGKDGAAHEPARIHPAIALPQEEREADASGARPTERILAQLLIPNHAILAEAGRRKGVVHRSFF